MNIEEQSAVQKKLEEGKNKIGTEERKIVKGSRRTQEGRDRQAESEEARKKE